LLQPLSNYSSLQAPDNTLPILKTNIKVKPLPNPKTTPFIPGKPPPHSKDKFQGKGLPHSKDNPLHTRSAPFPFKDTYNCVFKDTINLSISKIRWLTTIIGIITDNFCIS